MGLLKSRWSSDDFREYALFLDQYIKMAREATEGEAKLLDSDEKRTRLYNLLVANTSIEESGERIKNSTAQGNNKINRKGKSKNTKLGNRKPKGTIGWSAEETERNTEVVDCDSGAFG